MPTSPQFHSGGKRVSKSPFANYTMPTLGKTAPDRHALPVLGKTAPATQPAPKVAPEPTAQQAAQNQASAVRSAAATASHNTFRPEIFRVTEGYLN